MQLGILYEYWLVMIAALFVIVNPLTTAFMFLSMLPKASAEIRAQTARRALIIASGVLFSFALLGGLKK